MNKYKKSNLQVNTRHYWQRSNEILLEVDQRYKEFLESNDFSDNVFATFVVE